MALVKTFGQIVVGVQGCGQAFWKIKTGAAFKDKKTTVRSLFAPDTLWASILNGWQYGSTIRTFGEGIIAPHDSSYRVNFRCEFSVCIIEFHIGKFNAKG